MKYLSTLVLCLVAGCGGKSTSSSPDAATTVMVDPLANITSVDVSPATASVTIANAVVATQQFTATAHYADGHSADITSAATWTLSDPGVGSITNGSFASVVTRGGKSVVTVAAGSATATAALTVKWTSTRGSTDDSSTAAASASVQFSSATSTDATLAPTLAYPLDGVVVPVNLGELEIQWTKPTGAADLFEVALLADTLDLRIYTNAPETAGGRIHLLAAEWNVISETVAGEPVEIKVTGMVSSAPATTGAGVPVTMHVDSVAVNGGIYYWTPTNQGIERHAFGDTLGLATNFYSTTNSGGHCVACHVISRDGTKAAVTFDGGAAGNSAILDVASATQVVPESQGVLLDFASFSPDGSKIIAAHLTGTLTVYDSTGGAKLNDVDLGSTGWATQPDWSADGKSLVYVKAPMGTTLDWDFTGGTIMVATGPGDGTFSSPTALVTSDGTDNNYYPSFSPDGKWILFNHAASGSAYNNSGATLSVISADGTIGPIALATANATGALTNSWPRWSPFIQQHTDGTTLLYFTFSSKRSYGIELTQPMDIGSQRPQIWMSSFDPAAAATMTDPSAAPFWLPFQDITTNNHIAQWTTQVVGVQ